MARLPLSSVEVKALQHDRSAVRSLPQALREVPDAMVDAATSSAGSALSRTEASELLFEHPELGPLLRAVERPRATASPLSSLLSKPASNSGPGLISTASTIVFFVLPGLVAVGLGLALRTRRGEGQRTRSAAVTCVVAGSLVLVGLLLPIGGGEAPLHAIGGGTTGAPSVVSASDVQGALATLEQVYDDVVPALQIAGAAGRIALDPQTAVAVLGADPPLEALNHFVTDFNALYGAGVLITQQAAFTETDSVAPHAMRGLAWLALTSGLLLLLTGALWATRVRTRGRPDPSDLEAHAGADASRVRPAVPGPVA